MAIRDEIKAYIDGNGLVAPNLVPPSTLKGSDNGPMYTSEYYVILKKWGILTPEDKSTYEKLITKCVSPNGMLNRVPLGQSDGQEQADDYYGVLNASKQLGITSFARGFLRAMFKYLGFLNNVSPGTETLDSFLIRQPQLVAAMVSAAFPSLLNPLHWLIRLLFFPAFLAAAITIFVSCIDTPASNADARRLSWHLLQSTIPVSLLCKFASLFWYRRLNKTYGINGMRAVANIYYKPSGVHPFCKYWID